MKNTTKKKRAGRPSGRQTTLAVLRSMLTVPKREGHYKGERVPLDVKTVASWTGDKESFVREMERGRKGYPMTAERAQLISAQTSISEDWILAAKPNTPPRNWYNTPFSQADFDNRQIELKKRPREVQQWLVSISLVRNAAMVAEILLRADEQKNFEAVSAKLKGTLDNLYLSLTNKAVSLVGNAVLTSRRDGKPARPNLDALLDGFEKRLKKIA